MNINYLSAKWGFGVAAALDDPFKADMFWLIPPSMALPPPPPANLKMDQFSTCQFSKPSSKVNVKLDSFKLRVNCLNYSVRRDAVASAELGHVTSREKGWNRVRLVHFSNFFRAAKAPLQFTVA